MFFRLFDIYKPLGITYVERLGGATGIMLDDVVAALYANMLLHGLLYFSC
jgi:phosphatidylglycerophosphatase A